MTPLPTIPEIREEEVDILIVGGGLAGCGAAFEAGAWRAAARAAGRELRIRLVDKAGLERSGALAAGLSVIGAYLGTQDPADYARAVSDELMGLCRDDLAYDLGRHLDDSVHRFEEWGLPIRKDPADEERPLAGGGAPLRSGKWGIVVDGESLKPLVAAAARAGLGPECIEEQVVIVRLLRDRDDPHRIGGAIGFSLREPRVHLYRCTACLLAAGGAAGLFGPRGTGEGRGRTWLSLAAAGSTYAMAAELGAELTMMESRMVALAARDGLGPVEPWLGYLKARLLDAEGRDILVADPERLAVWGPCAETRPLPTGLRLHLVQQALLAGAGPIQLDCPGALAAAAEHLTPREVKRLGADAWQISLSARVTQAGFWAGANSAPEQRGFVVAPAEPCLAGSVAAGAGLWVSGPPDLGAPTSEAHPEAERIPAHLPSGWHWGYRGMTTVAGLFAAGDGVGASGLKYAAGSHAEGRIAAKAMVAYCLDQGERRPAPDTPAAELAALVWEPVRRFQAHAAQTTDPGVNPGCIAPDLLQARLQRLMDDHAGGIPSAYRTNARLLDAAEVRLAALKEDAGALAARDLHELLRVWEVRHRILTAEAHVKHLRFREETRYPGSCYRMDRERLDDEQWKCFVNSVYDPASGTWTLFKRAHHDLVERAGG